MSFAKMLACGVLVAGLATSAQAQQLFTVTGNVDVPDGSGEFAGMNLNVPNIGTIQDVDVNVIIASTWQGDIIAEVEQAGGARVRVIDRPGWDGVGFGFSTDNFGNPATGAVFTLDDEAVSNYDSTGGIDNATGPWQTDGGSLSTFDGASAGGDWTLWVSDNAAADFSSIQSFGLNITVPEPATLALLGLGGLTMLRRRR
jgi:subtilisin-like proprotein convertase family protein